MIRANVIARLVILKRFMDEVIHQVHLFNQLVLFLSWLPPEPFLKTGPILPDVGQNGWVISAALPACLHHEIKFTFSTAAIFASILLSDAWSQRRSKPAPENEDGNRDVSVTGKYHVNPLLEGEIDLEREIFPEQGLEQQPPRIPAPQPFNYMPGPFTLFGHVPRARDQNANDLWRFLRLHRSELSASTRVRILKLQAAQMVKQLTDQTS